MVEVEDIDDPRDESGFSRNNPRDFPDLNQPAMPPTPAGKTGLRKRKAGKPRKNNDPTSPPLSQRVPGRPVSPRLAVRPGADHCQQSSSHGTRGEARGLRSGVHQVVPSARVCHLVVPDVFSQSGKNRLKKLRSDWEKGAESR
jgi:hypothetical protein